MTNSTQTTEGTAMNITCGCSEEYGPCEQHGNVLAVREGSSTRTADELVYVYVLDCFGILDTDLTSVAKDLLRRVEEDWEDQGGGLCWIDDEALADELRDLAFQLENTIGAWTFWEDGYRIVEPTEDCPLN